MKTMAMKIESLVSMLAMKDFGADDVAVAIVIETLKQTVSDIKSGRGIHARKTPLQKKLAIEDARAEAICMVGGLLGEVDHSASASAA